MMSASPPKTAEQFVRYHEEEFSNGTANYYTEGDRIVGQWHGKMAAALALVGDVDIVHSSLLANGQHPFTAEQLVRHQKPRLGPDGETMTMAHRAGLDLTFSAPKSVTLTALVGGDAWVRAQHEAAARAALDVAVEPYIQARMGANQPTEATHKLVAALFPHDSSRPVVTERFPDGYAAPQVHTHAFVFNVTQTADGRTKPLQSRELYVTQGYATAVYRSDLAQRLSTRYHVVRDPKTGAPEIAGYTEDYLKASSPRRGQIDDWLDEHGLTGAKASEIAALETRDAKLDLSKEAVQRQHQQLAAEFGNQPQRVVREAKLHPPAVQAPTLTADEAVGYAIAHGFERRAVIDDRQILRTALSRSMLDRTVGEIHTAFERQIQTGALIVVPQRQGATGRKVTTPEMQRLERDNVDRMARGQATAHPLVAAHLRRDVDTLYPHLSAHQRDAADHLLSNSNRVHALQGKAGTGKTTLLAAIRDLAERDGYDVRGYAPSSRATLELAKAGMPTITLQQYLARPDEGSGKRLQILDESSLTSTVQMQAFLARQRPDDRILVVGDRQQHQAVDAGTPFKQLQDAGIGVTTLDEIVRQKHPEVKAIVERLATGEVKAAIALADAHGRVHGIADQGARYQAITADYLTDPDHTLVISPDNESRRDLNTMIHRALQARGTVAADVEPTRVLVAKDLTGAQRQWVAGGYTVGDIVRYTRGSAEKKIAAGDYGRVTAINPQQNRVRVRLDDRPGRSLRTVTYDPRRLKGVTLYREADRQFAVGDRVQFSALNKDLNVANRERGHIAAITPKAITVAMEHRTVTIPTTGRVHLDYGYAVTSHSVQSETDDRALVHADTTLGATLVNQQFAYVAGSRPEFDLQWYTDNRGALAAALSRDNTPQTAIDAAAPTQTQAATPAPALRRGR